MNKGWTVDSAKRFFEQKSKDSIKFNVEEKPEPKKLREVLHDIDFGDCRNVLK